MLVDGLRRHLLVLACLAGLGSPSSHAAEMHRITMKAADYEPAQLSVRVGDTVEWANEDIVAHTATARDRSWDVNVLPRKSGRLEMKTVGTFSYYCRYHPNMKGEIVVTP